MTQVGPDIRDEVFERIDADRELLAETCLELGNTYGPCGHEQPVADAVSAWYERHGFRPASNRSCPTVPMSWLCLPARGPTRRA